MKRLLYAAAGLAVIAIAPTGAKAQDAEWGCQILLCAASQNPSWHGVPYCVPPMKKLISAMAKPGFDWPICHQAKAGEPGREVFEECPAGSHPASSGDGDDHSFRDEKDQCVRIVDRCKDRSDFFRLYGNEEENQRSGITVKNKSNINDTWDRDNGCKVLVTSPRPRRADPWYFDIPNDKGIKERFWFNLRT